MIFLSAIQAKIWPVMWRWYVRALKKVNGSNVVIVTTKVVTVTTLVVGSDFGACEKNNCRRQGGNPIQS
jgi:hypothetical protein